MTAVVRALAAWLCAAGLLVASQSLAADKNAAPKTVVPSAAPVQAPAPVPAPTPAIPRHPNPAIPSDALGPARNLDAIRDANAARDIQRLEELEKLYRDPMRRGRPDEADANNPSDQLGIRGRLSSAVQSPGPSGSSRDCLDNPADCLNRSPGDSAGPNDRLGSPPTAGGAVPDPRGRTSAGGGDPRDTLVNRLGQRGTTVSAGPIEQGGESASTSTTNFENGDISTNSESSEDGESHTHVIAHDDGSEIVQNETTYSEGGGANYYHEKDANGDGVYYSIFRDANGTTIRESKGFFRNGVAMPPSRIGGGVAGGPSGQPSEVPYTGGGNDGCDWAPLHGCLNPRGDIGKSIKAMTTQPSTGDTGTGPARSGPGIEAVINTEGVQGRGNSRRSEPYDPRDPEEGAPGGPSGPGRSSGSDAGLDASMGALPAPPPE